MSAQSRDTWKRNLSDRIRPGAVFGDTTVVRKVRGQRAWLCRCACGRTRPARIDALLAHRYKEISGCYFCRWTRPGGGMRKSVKTKCSGCTAPLVRIAAVAGASGDGGISVCDTCRRKRDNASRVKRSRIVVGRVCVGCKRTDGETNWSALTNACQGCARMGERNGFCACRAPMWRGPNGPGKGRRKDRPMACRAGCKP